MRCNRLHIVLKQKGIELEFPSTLLEFLKFLRFSRNSMKKFQCVYLSLSMSSSFYDKSRKFLITVVAQNVLKTIWHCKLWQHNSTGIPQTKIYRIALHIYIFMYIDRNFWARVSSFKRRERVRERNCTTKHYMINTCIIKALCIRIVYSCRRNIRFWLCATLNTCTAHRGREREKDGEQVNIFTKWISIFSLEVQVLCKKAIRALFFQKKNVLIMCPTCKYTCIAHTYSHIPDTNVNGSVARNCKAFWSGQKEKRKSIFCRSLMSHIL